MKKNINAEKIYHDINYDNYIVQYKGDIESEISKKSDYYVTIINDKYAIVSVKKDVEININEDASFESVTYVNVARMYTLQEISPIEAAQINFLQIESPLNLTGKGVNVAIIDSGIDYLNEEFLNSNNETRIECIWDQTIITTEQDESNSIPFGTLYKRSKINDAIKANREGKSPYEIVPSKDEIGHGTSMSGIIGATGRTPELKGVLPECDFVVVKLMEDFSYEAQFKDVTIPVFNITVILAALQFLHEYTLKNYKPMVIYFPMGSSLGNHKGTGLLEQFIESIISTSGIVLVSGTGNQRETGGHSSGLLSKISGVEAVGASVIQFNVSPEQKNLWIEVWTDLPNIILIEVVSPSGEGTGTIPLIVEYTRKYKFQFEKTVVKINYYFPERNTGDELILLRFYDLQPGIWRIRVTADYILNGKYNAWMPQNGIRDKDTRFSAPDPFGTITNPSNSIYIVTAAAYNQNNNNYVNYSGTASLDGFLGRIDVASGSVNALTVAPNNKTAVVNGTSVSAAVVAGVCGMLFQWGIVDLNDPYIYSQTIKAYLVKGAIPTGSDITPNPYWGYGILNVPAIFKNMI
jgi:hypothetical protein